MEDPESEIYVGWNNKKKRYDKDRRVGEEHFPEDYTARLKTLKPANSLFGVCMGLNVDLRERGYDDTEIFYCPSDPDPTALYDVSVVMHKVIKKCRLDEQPKKSAYWRSRPYTERLEALEQLRNEYIEWRHDAQQGIQRVYRVIKR